MTVKVESPEIARLRSDLEMLGRIEWWLAQQEKSIRARLDALLETEESNN